MVNNAKIKFDARSENEGFARMVVMGFMMGMNPTMDELQDVKVKQPLSLNSYIRSFPKCRKAYLQWGRVKTTFFCLYP